MLGAVEKPADNCEVYEFGGDKEQTEAGEPREVHDIDAF